MALVAFLRVGGRDDIFGVIAQFSKKQRDWCRGSGPLLRVSAALPHGGGSKLDLNPVSLRLFDDGCVWP